MPPPEESQSLEVLLATLDDSHREWKANFKKLNEFRKKNGNASPSINDNANLEIAQWAREQRVTYNDGMLNETHKKCLKQINFIFQSTSNGTISKKGCQYDETKWDAKLQALMAYKKKHGDCLVPRKHPELGGWVNNQRSAFEYFTTNKKSKITQERVNKLDAVGFSWKAESPQYKFDETKWDAKLQALMAYKKKHGDCLVPRKHPELGGWVNNQRSAFEYFTTNKKSKITQERVNKLDAVGFCWKPERRDGLFQPKGGEVIEARIRSGAWRVSGGKLVKTCKDPNCLNFVQLGGYCKRHGKSAGMVAPQCSRPDCENQVQAHGFCAKHGAKQCTGYPEHGIHQCGGKNRAKGKQPCNQCQKKWKMLHG